MMGYILSRWGSLHFDLAYIAQWSPPVTISKEETACGLARQRQWNTQLFLVNNFLVDI